jgi:cell division protein FtsB
MSVIRRATLTGRRALIALVGVTVILGLVVAFSGSLSRSTDVESQAEQARAEVESLKQELAAVEAERVFFESEEFVRWQARALGLGKPAEGEELFTLPDDAPEPQPITPIGPQELDEPLAPFDAWMELLFGA